MPTASNMHRHASSTGAAGWIEAVDTYEDLHAVPLMTIRKNKGAGYLTVIFAGLDDGAWWISAGVGPLSIRILSDSHSSKKPNHRA